jgi:hypothetical protein
MELMQTILASLSELIPPSVTNLTQKQFFSWHALPIWIFAFPRALKSRPSPVEKHSVGFIEPQSIFFPHNNKHKPKHTHMSQPSVVKVEAGNVKTFTSAGSGLSSFRVGSGPSEAVSALIVGDEIQVTRRDGKVVICTHYGSQKRII